MINRAGKVGFVGRGRHAHARPIRRAQKRSAPVRSPITSGKPSRPVLRCEAADYRIVDVQSRAHNLIGAERFSLQS